MDTLQLERRDDAYDAAQRGEVAPGIAITPAIGGDYWTYRVRLSERQALLGFPKFSTVGVGFAIEEDWNCNLPHSVEPGELLAHIEHNRADESVTDDAILAAVRLIDEAVRADGTCSGRCCEPAV